jgi:hypothetical protein
MCIVFILHLIVTHIYILILQFDLVLKITEMHLQLFLRLLKMLESILKLLSVQPTHQICVFLECKMNQHRC